MLLTWYGHSCFKLDFGSGGSAVFDPYEKGSVPGIELPALLEADSVLISHQHHDHNAAARVRLTGKKPAFAVEKVDCYHDDEKGAKRGRNTIHIVSFGGLRAAHLGDLGCLPSPSEKGFDGLMNLDLMLVPVGGTFTIDAAQAKELLDKFKPRVAVPMHYREGRMGFPVLGTLDAFLSLLEPELIHRCEAPLELTGSESGIYIMPSPAER